MREINQRASKHRSIRQALADHTRAAHETLHHHRWISRLTSASLSEDQYFLILNAYLGFYRQLEQKRASLGVYESLHLSDAVANLEFDTACEDAGRQYVEITQNLNLNTPPSVLGALYVLHGARFGAAILNKHVSKTLPQQSRRFLQNTTSTHLWRALVAEIELLKTDRKAQQELFIGADETFTTFGRSVTDYCETACHIRANANQSTDSARAAFEKL